MAKGYCSHTDVSNLLGVTFTAAQNSEADTLIGMAENYIDRETRRGWIIPAITGERYNLRTATLYLRYRPVTSVRQVRTRTQAINDLLYTAIANVDYEVFDLNLGQINFQPGYAGPRAVAFVDYTPNLDAVPADIAQAAAMIVANTMKPLLLPDAYGIAETRFGRETGLKFNDNGITITIPEMARELIRGWTLPVFA